MLSSEESLSQKFVNKGFWLYLFTFLIGPLGYFIKVIISRDLGVEEVGMLYGVIALITFLSMYNDLGCTESLSYFLPKHIVNKEYGKAKYLIFLVIKIQLISSLLIYSTIYLGADWLATHYFKSPVADILRIGGLFFIGINIMHIVTIFFGAVQDTKLQKGVDVIRTTTTAIGSGILFFADFGNLERYMTVWIIGLCMGIVFGSIFFLKKYYIPYFIGIAQVKSKILRTSFLKYAFGTFLTANIANLLAQIDMQLIIYKLTAEDVGYYSTYLSLIGIPYLILTPIIGFLFPVISELSGRNEGRKIESIIKRFWTYFGIIGIWAGVFLFQNSEVLSILFFGEKFREAGEILAYSAPFIILNFLIQITFQVLAGLGKIKKRAQILAIVLVINVGLNIILIDALGAKGSALAVGLSWIPLYYMSTKATELKLSLFGEKSWYINLIGAILTYGMSVIVFERIYNFGPFTHILFAILSYMIIFSIINYHMIRDAIHTIQEVRKSNKTPISS